MKLKPAWGGDVLKTYSKLGKYYAERRKPYPKKYILQDSVSMKFKHRQNLSMAKKKKAEQCCLGQGLVGRRKLWGTAEESLLGW